MECPFLCGFHTSNDDQAEYQITAHIDRRRGPEICSRTTERRRGAIRPKGLLRTLNQRRERATNNAMNDDFPYAECPTCGDFVHLIELDEHMNNHLSLQYPSGTIADMANLDSGLVTNNHVSSNAPEGSTTIARPIDKHDERSQVKKSTAASAVNKPQGTRLGKKELGPYAFEKRMPESMLRQIRDGEPTRRSNRIGRDGQIITDRVVENEVPGLIPIITRLCEASSGPLSAIYVCRSNVHHVHKGTNPGHFCGYRNIQMLASYIRAAKAKGHQRFEAGLPGILQIQDLIEEAWDRDPYSVGRQETGGIRNTRKWIGTPEVVYFCKYLDLAHSVYTFSHTDDKKAHMQLLDFVERYFSRDISDVLNNVHKSHRPPLFFQQPGHSMTIIGFERCKDDKRNLLVFDPSFGPGKQLQDLATKPSRTVITANMADRLLKSYRRSNAQLSKYDEFEILT
ncbi:DUF1671-domain-containing protein [Aureobasidium sp. EXF-3400]|nr:DUF1671-domain-containing protein [Aureobasidium sp. EXF-12344]KAI4775865.1 DUF1671-domain-containing protein [Aureobasidium sp. EXF-3400]